MTKTLQRTFAEAAKLPPRRQNVLATRWLVELIEESPTTEISDEWRREIRRRVTEIKNGQVKMIPAEQTHRKIQRLLKKQRA